MVFFSIYAYVIQISIQLAFENGIFNVHVKSNNKVVVDAFNHSRSFDNELVLTISQYCAILSTHNDNQLTLIWRQVNRVVYSVDNSLIETNTQLCLSFRSSFFKKGNYFIMPEKLEYFSV